MDPNCPICNGEGWVCDAHRDQPWLDGKGCCGEPGVCNPEGAMPPGFEVTQSIGLDETTGDGK